MKPRIADHIAASLRVSEKAAALAAVLVEREPGLLSPEDARQHFAFLRQALEFGRPQLFTQYVAWCKPTLAHRGVAPATLALHLHAMTLALEEALSANEAGVAAAYVRQGASALAGAPESVEPLLGSIAGPARTYLDHLLQNDTDSARAAAREALGTLGLAELYREVLAPAMKEVGLLWQCGRIDIAQEHYCAGVTQMVMGECSATVKAVRGAGTAVVACVAGEQHSIGSRMVADLLDMTGWRTLWLGASTPTSDLLRMVVDTRADLLALSCSHAPCLHDMASLITALRVLPECRHVKVLVGGYAFDSCDGLWRSVGADAYARDAHEAAQVARGLVGV